MRDVLGPSGAHHAAVHHATGPLLSCRGEVGNYGHLAEGTDTTWWGYRRQTRALRRDSGGSTQPQVPLPISAEVDPR